MTKYPLVSIGIPVYNEEKYLALTISSALNQTYPNLEIIISDNYSTDASYDIARELTKADKRVKLIRQKRNIGALENFNILRNLSSGEYFCWLGSHDILVENFIENAVRVLNENLQVAMVYPLVDLIDTKGNFLSEANDDIETINLRYPSNACKIVNNLHYCFSIHGLFRRNIAMKLPMKNIIASDFLMLFCTGLYGSIQRINQVGLLARKVREESPDEANDRYKKTLSLTYTGKNLFAETTYYHYLYLFKVKPFAFVDNIKALKKLKFIFCAKFSVSTKEVVSILFNRIKLFK